MASTSRSPAICCGEKRLFGTPVPARAILIIPALMQRRGPLMDQYHRVRRVLREPLLHRRRRLSPLGRRWRGRTAADLVTLLRRAAIVSGNGIDRSAASFGEGL